MQDLQDLRTQKNFRKSLGARLAGPLWIVLTLAAVGFYAWESWPEPPTKPVVADSSLPST